MKAMKSKNVVMAVNSMTGAQQSITERDTISLYVCGITPYDYAHVGHGRCYVHFDVVYRLLTFLGYSVTYVRNITDIDDKILAKAAAEFPASPPIEGARLIATRFIEAFDADLARLNTLIPTAQPTVTSHVPQVIEFIAGLLQKGAAYHVGDDIYFDTNTFVSYGQLAKKPIDEQEAGARVAVAEAKKSPADFVLWKGNAQQLFWQAPWGYGRPGWHIECSAFVREYIGDTVDIHGGGIDLIFPHHENERAQSEMLTGKPFATCWMHNAHVTLHAEKMSKSTGNFYTLRDLFTRFEPMAVRFYLLQHHYRTPLDFSQDALAAADRAYRRLIRTFETTVASATLSHSLSKELVATLCEDINTPKCLGLVFANLDAITGDSVLRGEVLAILQEALGLTCLPLAERQVEMTAQMATLIAAREAARTNRDWATADRIREQLKELGYVVVDKK